MLTLAKRLNLLYLAALAALAAGPGALSIDGWLARRRHRAPVG